MFTLTPPLSFRRRATFCVPSRLWLSVRPIKCSGQQYMMLMKIDQRLRDSILMCDPSCALGNDRAAGISFIHEQLSTMIHLLHLLLPIHQDVFSCSGAYTFCTAFYFQFCCHTCGPCLVISELGSGDTNVRASNLRWKRGYQFH